MRLKYIKLFESFQNEDATDFRVEIVDDSIQEGYYLFSSITDDYDSIFGVFNLQGLKELEDAINTQILLSDIANKQINNKIPDELNGFKYVVNKIKTTSKFIRVIDDESIEWEIRKNADDVNKDLGLFGLSTYDLPDTEIWTMKMKDLPFGSYLNRNIISMGLTIIPSKEKGPEDTNINIPIVLNQCHVTDYHNQIKSSKTSESIFDFLDVAYFDSGVEWFEKRVNLNDIEKYLPSVFEKDVPKGFLNVLNKLKSNTKSDLKEFRKLFNNLVEKDLEAAKKEAERISISYHPDNLLPSVEEYKSKYGDEDWREVWKKEYKEANIRYFKIMSSNILDYTSDIFLDMDSLIKKYEGLLKGYTFEKEKEFINYWRDQYQKGAKGLPPINWPSNREWPQSPF